MNPKPGLSTKDECLTPPELIKALGIFDLDPCSPINRPWPTANHHFTINDNGLLKEWFGRVFMNSPYGKELTAWLNRIAMHGNGIALTFARTETKAFQQFVFPHCDSILFLDRRITFLNVDGTPAEGNAGAPSVLIAYGENNSEALSESGITGAHVPINRIGIIVIGMDKTWQMIIKKVFIRLNRPTSLQELYKAVEDLAPERVSKSPHYREKIRQIVQKHFTRVARGQYV